MKYFYFITIAIVLVLVLWPVFIEPNILEINYINIKNSDLAGYRIVFASDFHIKPYENNRLRKIIKRINATNPDLVLLGGDYGNGHNGNFTMPISKIVEELKKLQAPDGIIAVMGNHDGWQGKYSIIKEFEKNNITVLENDHKRIKNLTIAGVEDIQTGNPNIEKALSGAQKPIILLSHNPDIFPFVPDKVMLTLAGHLHGGQVYLPFRGAIFIPSKYGVKYLYGLVEEKSKKLYTSRGLGNSILPIRFNCPPEIVVIDFE